MFGVGFREGKVGFFSRGKGRFVCRVWILTLMLMLMLMLMSFSIKCEVEILIVVYHWSRLDRLYKSIEGGF